MQIAAMKPIAIDKDGVDQNTIDQEKEVAEQQAKDQGKPDHIIEKIVDGKLNKFINQNTLLNQVFVKDNEQSVKKMMQAVDEELEIQDFIRIEVGD
jgi:elongation factor Ts